MFGVGAEEAGEPRKGAPSRFLQAGNPGLGGKCPTAEVSSRSWAEFRIYKDVCSWTSWTARLGLCGSLDGLGSVP